MSNTGYINSCNYQSKNISSEKKKTEEKVTVVTKKESSLKHYIEPHDVVTGEFGSSMMIRICNISSRYSAYDIFNMYTS